MRLMNRLAAIRLGVISSAIAFAPFVSAQVIVQTDPTDAARSKPADGAIVMPKDFRTDTMKESTTNLERIERGNPGADRGRRISTSARTPTSAQGAARFKADVAECLLRDAESRQSCKDEAYAARAEGLYQD